MRRSQLWGVCLLLMVAGCAPARPEGSDAVIATWRGCAVFHGASLDFEVRFHGERDSLRATFSSPDLLILDQPLDSVRHVGSNVEFSTRDEHPLHFRGMVVGDTIRGSASVPTVPGVVAPDAHGVATDLRFEMWRDAVRANPPYATRAVGFDGAGVHLAGTLWTPFTPAAGRPAVVILQGSSSNLSEEYRFYADHFVRAGLIVLTFDKRGNGESSGDYLAATYDDLAGDGAAAVEFVRRQPGMDSARVGVWGLSQGAFIAPLVASRVRSLAFLVAVSPPGVMVGESAAFQDSVRLAAAGYSSVTAGLSAQINRRIITWLRVGGPPREVDSVLARVVGQSWRRASSLPERLPGGPSLEGWYWRGRALDPVPLWRSLRAPVLVVFGAADELVPAQVSADRIRRALRDGGNGDATVRVFPAANHVLRQLPLVAGGKWDWPRAAPGYIDDVTSWILAHSH